jgi:cytochrome c-type biogenesis protein CcmF
MHSLLSRESLFLVNNLLFMGILAVCFWGVIFPLISELFTGQKVTVGPPFYERATARCLAGCCCPDGHRPAFGLGPFHLQNAGRALWKPAMLVAGGAGDCDGAGRAQPLGALLASGWWPGAASITLYDYTRAVLGAQQAHRRKPAVALWRLAGRNRRRYGGYIIHLGVVLMAMGVIGIELFQTETQGTIRPGESPGRWQGYTMTFRELAEFDTPMGATWPARWSTFLARRQPMGELYPRRDYYYAQQQPMTIPGVRSTMEDDLYVLLVDWQPISAAWRDLQGLSQPAGQLAVVWRAGLYPGHDGGRLAG